MKSIVGMHYWEQKIHLSWSSEESISTAAFNLPADLRKDDIYSDSSVLGGVLRAVREYLGQKVGITDFGLIVCTPDSFGLEDIRRIYSAGREVGIDIVRTLCETMSLALSIYGEYDFDGRMLAAVVGDGRVGVSEYEFSDRGVRKIDTYAAGKWGTTAFHKAPFLGGYANKLFDTTEAQVLFCAGNMNSTITFEQSIKSYADYSPAFANRGMQMKMVDSKAIVEGLGYYCGKLEEREAFVGLGVMDTLTPYDIFLEINGQMFRVINADTEFPGSEGIEMRKMPEGNGTETFKVYENRNKGFYQIGEVEVPTDNVQDFLKKPVWVGLGVNKDRELSLVIQNMATEAYLEFPVGPAQAQGATAGSGDDITEFIEKILPIIDNLEYASKFAQDEDNPYTKGIIQTYENAVKILEENGITIISGEGEPFDFNYQNAVAHVTDVDLPENTVKQVMQTGYVYKGKVIRTASVIVAN